MDQYSTAKTAKLVCMGILLTAAHISTVTAQTTQTFTSSGSFSAAAGVTNLSVQCWGGGGGGGNAAHSGAGVSRGGGGAGGAYASKNIPAPNGTYTITAGAGGTGGNAGTDSWFGCSCTVNAKGGAAGGNANKSYGTAGVGTAAGSTGDVGGVFAGGSGAAASVLGSGAGGGAAGSTGGGSNASLTIVNGNATADNGGAGAAGYLLSLGVGNGNNGNDYGGGGSGANCVTLVSGSSATGGKGGDGLVTVTYTCPNYSLTNTANTSVCAGTTAAVTLTSGAANLPAGTYTVTYNLSSPNAATGNTASMTVTTAGTGSFTTSVLSNGGLTTVTITDLKSGSGVGCSNTISSNNVAGITVNTAPSVISQPSAPAVICLGNGTQSISVTAAGSGLSYNWRKNGFPVVNGGVYSGQGTSTLTLTNTTASDTGSYDVIVSGLCSPPVTSTAVTVTVYTATFISADAAPLSQVKLLNATPVDLSVTASGTSVSYQWYSNTSNNNSGGISVGAGNGGQTMTYTPSTSSESSLFYYCVVSGTCGTQASSAVNVIATNTDTWTGEISSDWSNSGNWNTGSVPSGVNHVLIPAGAIPYPELSSSCAVNDIAIDAGASVTPGNNILTINGAFTGTGTITGSHDAGVVINGAAGTVYFTNNGTGNYLKYFTVGTGASVTLGSVLNISSGQSTGNEGVLTVNGTGVLNTAGMLTVKSNAYGTASIAQGSSAGGYITGDVTVERYIPQNSNKAWRMLATNTLSANTIKQVWQEDQPAMEDGNPGYGVMITNRFTTLTDAQNAGFDTLSNTTSIYSFNAAVNNFTNVTSTNTKLFSSEEGYFIFIRGDRRPGQFVAYSAPVSATVLRSKGAVFQGDQPVKNVTAGKYMLLRNPFASAIDMRNIVIGGGTADAFQVWDPKLAGTAGNGAYQTLTKIGSDYVVTPGGGSYPPSGSVYNIVESGAAFIAQATGTDGTVQVTESCKVTGSNNVFRPSSGGYSGKRVIASLYAATGDRPLVDGNMMLFDDTSDNGFNRQDVRKLLNMAESFSINCGENLLVVERRKLPSYADTITFDLRNLKRINYEVEFITVDMQIQGMYGYIEDSYTGTGLLLNPSGNTLFPFAVTDDPASFTPGRLKIIFKPYSVLPLSFTNVNVAHENKKVVVRWQVENEDNIEAYQLESSADGNQFHALGGSTTVGNGFYTCRDETAGRNLLFHRIKAIEYNGKTHYSKVVQTAGIDGRPEVIVCPNPVTQNNFTIMLNDQPGGMVVVTVQDAAGQCVYKNSFIHTGGNLIKQLILPRKTPAGVYHLIIADSFGKYRLQKVLMDPGQ